MAQYDKLINLGLLSQFLTKAKTIFAPKITASGILKGDGQGGVTAATAGTDYATPGLGLTGAKVGDLVRVNAVDSNGKPTSWKHVPLNEIKCNKNLLDNWYFVGGGSQLGDGVFPINQRGQTTYSGVGYGIDRWKSQSSINCTLTLDYITIGMNHNYTNFYQDISNDLSGKTITASCLTSNGLISMTFVASATAANTVVFTSTGGVAIYLRVLVVDGRTRFTFFAGTGASGELVSVNVIAVKLELGSEQTLAHNEGTEENPVWVLNEIPDYGEELRKCQRYYYRIAANAAYNTFAQGFISNSSNRASFLIYFPVPMASAPTPKYSGTFGINSTQFGDATHYNTSTTSMIANAYFIANYNVPQGTAATLQDRGNGNTVMEFSAEP